MAEVGGGSEGPCANNYLYFSHNKGSYVCCTEGSGQCPKGAEGGGWAVPAHGSGLSDADTLRNADAAWKAALREAAAIRCARHKRLHEATELQERQSECWCLGAKWDIHHVPVEPKNSTERRQSWPSNPQLPKMHYPRLAKLQIPRRWASLHSD